MQNTPCEVLRQNFCVYRGSSENITADHVPPKCLFPDPKPTNLITIPACKICNESSKLDDEYFRVCVLTNPDPSPIGWKIWDKKVIGSSLERSPPLRQRLLGDIIEVELRSPSGLIIGKAPGIRFEKSRINHVIQRIIRGLYWHHHKKVLPPETNFTILKDPHVSGVAEIINNHTVLSMVDKETFQYRHGVTDEDPSASIWLLRFYTRTTFLIITGDEGEKKSSEGLGL
jgi:hypothetical protein